MLYCHGGLKICVQPTRSHFVIHLYEMKQWKDYMSSPAEINFVFRGQFMSAATLSARGRVLHRIRFARRRLSKGCKRCRPSGDRDNGTKHHPSPSLQEATARLGGNRGFSFVWNKVSLSHSLLLQIDYERHSPCSMKNVKLLCVLHSTTLHIDDTGMTPLHLAVKKRNCALSKIRRTELATGVKCK
ncbi:hypothetical protein Tcan_02250 [Toxocara canis]|uniref:Uncharacterized protein n=1 Tax=Toxocara canis TaxID=6265 RepID=A0A0B2UPZ0_TOXCA|nr:hypothetical protein Tcan_02250 [Toxocara canis]